MSSSIKKKSSSMDPTVERIKPNYPIPILGDEFTNNIPECDAFIGIINDKKNTSIAIKEITNILPGFGHLKRCSEGRLLLAFVKNNKHNNTEKSFDSIEKLKSFLIDENFNLNIFNDDIKIISVPASSPKTKIQAQISSKVWPINFHPDPCIELILSNKFFNDNQLEIINKCMKICADIVDVTSVKNLQCYGSAVIVDPNDDSMKLLAVTISQTDKHPMWHAAMLAIDLVAKVQGGGAWKLLEEPSISNSTSRKRKLQLQLPLCYPEYLKNHLDLTDSWNFNYSKDDTNDDTKNIAYLCTNYWIFLQNEPCPLCAMALLHSRVSMIFYNNTNESLGVLQTKAYLHTLPGLNHRYRVWKNFINA